MLEAIQRPFAVYFNKQTMRVRIRVGVSKDGNAVGSDVDGRWRAVCLLVLAAVANSSLLPVSGLRKPAGIVVQITIPTVTISTIYRLARIRQFP